MNNEIGRKLTSLTLMAIMVVGGMTIAAPGFTPVAHANHNANLFVSAEDTTFENYMGGPQVIEVIVNDPDINDTDEAKGEPDVTVNGQDLRMVQAVDGNWYGYFADNTMATTADATSQRAMEGLDFGSICTVVQAETLIGPSFSDADGVAVPSVSCTDDTPQGNNVVREAKGVNTNVRADGQIGIDAGLWPFVQLYDLNPTGNVVVQYNRGGGAQMTTLTFDTVDGYAGAVLDRNEYPQGAELHATITDTWLDIDPTDEDSWTFGTLNGTTYYQVFDESGNQVGDTRTNTDATLTNALGDLMCDDNCVLLIDIDTQGKGNVITLQDNDNSAIVSTGNAANAMSWQTAGGNLAGMQPVTITEIGTSTGIFGTYDESDTSNLMITDDAQRRTSATFDYNDTATTVLVSHDFATIEITPVDDVWNSGEGIPIVIEDADVNKNSRVDEDMILSDPATTLIPALETGDPFTLGEGTPKAVLADFGTVQTFNVPSPVVGVTNVVNTDVEVQAFSDRALIMPSSNSAIVDSIIIDFGTNVGELKQTLMDPGTSVDAVNNALASVTSIPAPLRSTLIANTDDTNFKGYNFYNQDVQSFGTGSYDVYFLHTDGAPIISSTGALNDKLHAKQIADDIDAQSGLVFIDEVTAYILSQAPIDNHYAGLAIVHEESMNANDLGTLPIVADFFSYGYTNNGELGGERVANQIIRLELEESGDNTNTFEGELEYVMVNQLSILDKSTYDGMSTIASDPTFIAIEDLTDEDSIRVTYLDLGADGVSTQISDQQEAPSHSGVVSLNSDTYKIADTVTITLEDSDLNVESDLIDIYSIYDLDDTVGRDIMYNGKSVELNTGNLGRVLDVTFDDATWTSPASGMCGGVAFTGDTGLAATGFSLVETGIATGMFMGDFQIPAEWCQDGEIKTTTGLDIEVNYVDFRDASGEIIEVGDSAGVSANTGSVSLDRTVYPVPFGVPDDFADSNAKNISVFKTKDGSFLSNGDLSIHVRVNDVDFDISGGGEDVIAQNTSNGVGPVKISVIRGSSEVVLGYAGGPSVIDGKIGIGEDATDGVTQFGPIEEIAPDAGIFEADIPIRYTDGPASDGCPNTIDSDINDRFTAPPATGMDYCILQGDILQVEYTDPTDASGDKNTVTDSATFDLRNGVLQSDKSVYIIGSDMILTLIEPDFDLDNDQAETYDLDLIEWDSDAATLAMGADPNSDPNSDDRIALAFDPEPSDFRETGDSTGIFQIVIEIPSSLDGDRLERGEQIDLEYTDWGPSGSDFVGDEDEDIGLTVYTSNFGATVELDQKVYTWTDKVYITIVAPDHNFDSDLVDEIGETDSDPIKISTRGSDLDNYKLVETGTNTGIFTGEVILTGFTHDADGDTTTGSNGSDVIDRASSGSGPTDGKIPADDNDGITVSFEFSEDETVVSSALIRWNIGEVQWLEASYPATGTGIVRVIDPDMNLDPEAVDNFTTDVWSDSDSGGIDLTVTETNEATGIFEGTVFFTVTDESSGHRLRVAEGDTVTSEYEDNTLPKPYTTADELAITSTSLIGTIVPPLERAPASNLRVIDASGNSLDTVNVDQQVQISADLTNGQDKEQAFAYLVQIQDGNGVTVLLSWITGELSPNQSFSPAQSWTPSESGSYTATAFVWESVENPTALSPPVTTTITVS